MRKELQQLDRELSKAENVIVLRKDFTMFERNLVLDASSFLREIEKTAKKDKLNQVKLLISICG